MTTNTEPTMKRLVEAAAKALDERTPVIVDEDDILFAVRAVLEVLKSDQTASRDFVRHIDAILSEGEG